MLKNYIKVAIRNLIKSRVFSILNILGLAFGLCCTILIALWIRHEKSYDKFHEKKERIFLAVAELTTGGNSQYWTNTPAPMAPAMMDEVTGIEHAIRVTSNYSNLITDGSLRFEPEGRFVDSTFLDVFTFPLKYGDKVNALRDPYSIVLTEELSEKFFGSENPVGKTLTVSDMGTMEEHKVTGVFEKLPETSQLQFDFVRPFGTYYKKRTWMEEWGNYNDQTYILIKEGVNVSEVEDQIKDFIPQHQKESETILHLYPFQDVYLKADFSKGLGEGGRIIYVRLFSIIAVIIMVIACINFMNLSTARSGKRAKEVGVRKATGAHRSHLIGQFLGESLFISIVSVILAVTLADVLLPSFNEITGKHIDMPFGDPQFILDLLGVAVVVGLVAGSYPALSLSAFQPAKVLKGAMHSNKSLGGLRRLLVIFQFTLSIALIICTIVVYNQIQFILNKDLGLRKDNIVFHDLNRAGGHKDAYRNDLKQIAGVQNITYTNFNPLGIGNTTYSVAWPGKKEDDETYFHVIQTDHNFVKTFNIQLLEGRDLPEKVDTTMAAFLVNEQAIKVMGLEDAVGQEISLWGRKGKIYGVVKDFNHQSLFQKIDPVIIFLNPQGTWQAFIAINSNDIPATMAQIKGAYQKYDQEYPFDYQFMDQDYANNYKSVVTAGTLSTIFAVIAIVVSCLGLFGLALYMTEQRKKETGVRKVFGASVYQLSTLFSLDFLKLVLIAFIISIPLAWYVSDAWLSDFSFRIEVTYLPFVIGGGCALVIALLTVNYHIMRAAMADPVKALRYE